MPKKKTKLPNAFVQYLRALGSKGGKKAAGAGLKKRYAGMTAEERSAFARKAALARWKKKRKSS
jgi:hypothetical protein